MKYSVGQKVKITKANSFQPKEVVGKKGVIVKIDYECDSYEINLINKKFKKHNGFLYGEDEITGGK